MQDSKLFPGPPEDGATLWGSAYLRVQGDGNLVCAIGALAITCLLKVEGSYLVQACASQAAC